MSINLLKEPDAIFRAGEATPEDLLAGQLDVIDRRERDVAAFVTINREGAMEAARASTLRWSKGRPLSAIDGMVLGIKDVIETRDMPTGQGSPIWEGFETRRDAASVQALREAGAVILGKTTTTEFATRHPFAQTRNPHDLTRTPGGSSSGSAAALGAGMVAGALGTQVVASVLRPASYCGVIGYKPSFGTLNRGGSNDQLSQSCLSTMGLTLPAVWALANAIAARVGGDPGHDTLDGSERLPMSRAPARLAILRTAGWNDADRQAIAAFDAEVAHIEALGVKVLRSEDDPVLARFEEAILQSAAITERILAWEFAWPLRSYPFDQLSHTMRVRVEEGMKMSVSDYADALEARAALRHLYATLCRRVDGCIALSATGAAPEWEDGTGNPQMNIPASLLGAPALSLPLLSCNGLPLGLQMIGAVGGDATLMALARWRLENPAQSV